MAELLVVLFHSLDYAEICQELELLPDQKQIRPLAHAIFLYAESQRTVWRYGKSCDRQSALSELC